MLLFPYIFGRQGGSQIDKVYNLLSNEFVDFTLDMDIIYEQIQLSKTSITEKIYKKIQHISNPLIQNTLLNVKRDVFNERTKRIEKKINKNIFDQDTTDALESYVSLLHQKSDHLQKGDIIYKNTVHKSIEHLELLVAENYFQNGILFASSTLDSKIRNGNIKQSILSGKDKKLAYSLLKYFTRSVTKTTPFSTFNTIFCLERKEQSFSSLSPLKTSYISINNLTFHYVKLALLEIPQLYQYFQVEINPTIFHSSTHFHYFINQDNNDAFKKLKKSDIISYIVVFFKTHKIVTLKDLLKDLKAKVQESEEGIINFLKKIIKEGLLILHYPAGINDLDGMKKVLCFITERPELISVGAIQKLQEFLELLINTKRDLEATTTIAERRKIINKTFAGFKHIDCYLKNEGIIAKDNPYFNNIQGSDLFYEDSQQFIHAHSNTTDFECNHEALKALAQFAKISDIKFHIKENCKKLLVNHASSNTLSCLEFLENIYYPNIDYIFDSAHEMIQEQTKRNLAVLQEQIIMKVTSSLDTKSVDLKELLTAKHFQDNSINDFNVYCQLVPTPERNLMVINDITSGYGKSNSRFLNLYPDTVCKSYKDEITNKYSHAIVAEIRDASLHNTNKFPRLADTIIEIPGSNIDTSNYSKIRLKDLQIVINRMGKLALQLKSGREVIPIDFSMENPKRKSSLVKFFDLFSPSSYLVGLQYTVNAIDNYFKTQLSQSNSSLIKIPRLCFGSGIVIQRQKWLVKKSSLMELIDKQTIKNQKFINFYNIYNWARENNIPKEIFVKIRGQFNKSSDHSKPQYINFNIPLLVQYFETILPKADEIFEMTEMLPGSKDISNDVHSDGFVKEYILNYM